MLENLTTRITILLRVAKNGLPKIVLPLIAVVCGLFRVKSLSFLNDDNLRIGEFGLGEPGLKTEFGFGDLGLIGIEP